ncbi:MAG: VWA domain-containing protein [Acidobacteriota bacterium]
MRSPAIPILAAFAVLGPVAFIALDQARGQAPVPAKGDPDRPSFSQPKVTIEPRQKGPPSDGSRPENRVDLRVDTNVVLIPVAVNDVLLGRPVAGLEKQHFKITDNKIPQKISSFAMDDAPVALGLVFDTSSSMSSALAAARRAAALFVATANPGDQFLLVEFDSAPRLTVPLTEDLAHIKYEMTFTQSRGATALVDGVYMAMSEIKKSPLQRKALILVSDGGDNNSRYTVSELRTVLQESDVLIYSVSLVGDPAESNPGLLRLISEQTGGRMFVANSGLQDIASKISVDLRNRYLIGYVPNNYARDGKYHKVEVELNPPKGLPKLKAYWRKGYYAPTD